MAFGRGYGESFEPPESVSGAQGSVPSTAIGGLSSFQLLYGSPTGGVFQDPNLQWSSVNVLLQVGSTASGLIIDGLNRIIAPFAAGSSQSLAFGLNSSHDVTLFGKLGVGTTSTNARVNITPITSVMSGLVVNPNSSGQTVDLVKVSSIMSFTSVGLLKWASSLYATTASPTTAAAAAALPATPSAYLKIIYTSSAAVLTSGRLPVY